MGGGVGENKKQSIVVAGLFSYWGGGGRLWYAWVLAGQHMLVWGARSCTLSLSLSRLLRKPSLCTLPEVLLPGLPRDPRAGSGVKLDPGSLAVVPVKDFPRHSCCTVACLKSVTQIVHALCPAVIVVPTPSAFNSKCLQPDNACIMLYLSLSLSLSLSLCHMSGSRAHSGNDVGGVFSYS